MDFSSVDLTRKLKQAEFAELVGVSFQTVSDWVRAGRIPRGATGREWLHASYRWISEQAAGRGDESPKSGAQTRLANEQADAKAMENAITRREWVSVSLIGDVIGAVARQIRADLESVVPEIRVRHPDTPIDVLRIVEMQVAKAMQRASDARIDLGALAQADERADVDDDEEAGG